MTSTGGDFTKVRWLCTIIGLIFYLGDIGSDLLLTVQYFRAGHLTWAALTLVFILSGSLCVQIFSYVWFKDDKRDGKEDNLPTGHLIGIHVLQIGIITRYFSLLKKSFKALWFNQVQSRLFDLATDLSMLRLFETFLESVPQLVLQLYIILEHNHRSTLQYISMAVSFLNIAWSTVDYRRCLRRSLPHVNEMPCGIPTVVYLLYKVFTITPRILSLTLFIMLSTFSTIAMAFIWFLGTFWAYLEKTDFCTSRVLEYIYRATVGVILIFTFFNIKGENSQVPMTMYYIFSVSENLAAPILLFLFKPESEGTDYLLPIILFILISNSLGLGFLGLYYSLLHPHKVSDEIDGMERDEQTKETTRLNNFLQI
ncbi:XK-related protein 9-like isoform X1 [Xyrauchen texanus]|uniref:XK-related protein 9-like isoform X1 n=1 Tax=Xyrauchen texanus TaxID=154827 RepID=UPI0022418CF5|nr:XK-related protein 9-like isoform X1 [Xyrauchen texanus]